MCPGAFEEELNGVGTFEIFEGGSLLGRERERPHSVDALAVD
jgi:hypothetical protein